MLGLVLLVHVVVWLKFTSAHEEIRKQAWVIFRSHKESLIATGISTAVNLR
jgi:hypothetical protein